MGSRWSRPAVWLVVLAGVALNITLCISLWQSLVRGWHTALEDDAKTIGNIVEDEIKTYVLGLEGARGALIADQFRFDPNTFRKYAESRSLFKGFSGALGFGFIRAVPPGELANYEKQRSRVRPGFRVHPQTESDPHMVIELIEPVEENAPAIGLDISFETFRRQAALEALKENRAALTKKITLVQSQHDHHGFLFLLPIWKDMGKQKGFVGWAYAPIVLDRIFTESKNKLPAERLAQVESLEDHVSFSVGPPIGRSAWIQNYASREIHVAGRIWHLKVYASPNSLIQSGEILLVISLLGVGLLSAIGFLLDSAIRRQSQWLDAIIDSSSYSVIATRPDGTIYTFNKAAEAMLGYKAKDVVGRQTPALVHDPEEVVARAKALSEELGFTVEPGIESFVAKARITGADTNEWTIVRSDGSRFASRLCVTAMKDYKGRLVGYLGIGEDLSENKRMRETLERQQSLMIESGKLSVLGEMAGGIAHEINTPLTVIISNAEILKQGLENGKIAQDYQGPIAAIERVTWRIAKIVSSLRQFSRNAEMDDMRSFELKQVVEMTLDLCRQKLEHASIRLEVDIPPGLMVNGRESEISQVLMNLISNSLDAVQELDEKWIRIQAHRRSDNQAVLEVTDSGFGISPSVASKMMNPFFTTKDVGKGTGIGLSISRTLVANHQGKLYYDADSSRTRMIVELPLI